MTGTDLAEAPAKERGRSGGRQNGRKDPSGVPGPRIEPGSPPSPQATASAKRGKAWQAHLRSKAGRVLWLIGLVLVLFTLFEVWLTPLSEARSQRSLLARFQALAAAPLAARPLAPSAGDPVGILSIPALDATVVVVEGVSASTLKSGPGHLPGSPFPGQAGNAVVAGRRTTYGGPFHYLDRLRPGALIVTTTLDGQFRYHVTKVTRVGPGEADVLGPTGGAQLTLVTSDPQFVPSGRLVVVAELEGGALLPSLTQPISLVDGSVALGGDGGAIAATLLWGEMLALALVATFWLYRRLGSRVSAYLLTTPILLASMYLLFGSLDRLLPATL
jgi:sortase A